MSKPTVPLSSHLGNGKQPRAPQTWMPAQGVSAGQKETPDSRRAPTCMPSGTAGTQKGLEAPRAGRQLPRRACMRPRAWAAAAAAAHCFHNWGGWAWAGRCCSQSLGGCTWEESPGSGLAFTALGVFVGELQAPLLMFPTPSFVHACTPSFIHSSSKRVLRSPLLRARPLALQGSIHGLTLLGSPGGRTSGDVTVGEGTVECWTGGGCSVPETAGKGPQGVG